MNPELEFAAMVDARAAGPEGSDRLAELLREDHPVYDQRGAAAIVRMRGWVLLAMARTGLRGDALLFALEELDAGADPYLVAAAARALRSCPSPSADLAPFVMRALTNIRYRDEPVSFESYGEYATSSTATSPVRELLATLAWLGPRAKGVLGELTALRAGLPKKLRSEADRAIAAIGGADPGVEPCCALPVGLGAFRWAPGSRGGGETVESIVFEDHEGAPIGFADFFRGKPSIVVFFYTRCDNPLKCSLTVTKLARVQKLLAERGLDGEIRTAAITYDPGFDLPDRIRSYGLGRGARLDANHRMLRATGGFDALRRHFRLGVNFVESLVNRHRIELFVLDAGGRIAASFERIHWDEREVVDRAAEVLEERGSENRSTMWGALASLGVAFFPKCPVCWMAYLSMFGIAGVSQARYFAALQPVLVILMLINVASVWIRGRSTGRMGGAYLVSAGALAIGAARLGAGWESAAVWGVVLTVAGSLWSAYARSSFWTRAPKSVGR